MINFLNFKKLKKLKIFQPLQISFVHTWFTFQKLNKLVKRKANSKILKDFQPKEGYFLYVPASCLPYHISGYTTRTHEILKAISKGIEENNNHQNNYRNSKFSNAKLFVLTRSGYPWDRKDALRYPEDNKDYNILDGIRYDHIKTPKNTKLTALYAEEASYEIEKYIVKNNISCVHAASNHVNALPALIAAKRLGIPFQYEMRGLWELTRISRQPEFAKSHIFKLGLDLEAFVAKHADKVFVISEQLSIYIQKNWGISKEKIHLLPNCADTDRIKPDLITANEVLINNNSCNSSGNNSDNSNLDTKKIVIGYAGSLIVYEGLQTLLKAMNILVFKKKMNVHLNVIGDGEYRKTLEELALSLNLSSHVTFFGRLSPLDAKNKQDECALICIPREPFEVCKIIPPIKLVEAMAKGKCVVVPNLPVFIDELTISNKSEEELSNDSGCIFFKSGNAEDLAEVLSYQLSRLDEIKRRGENARKYVIAYRQWKMFAPLIMPMYSEEDLR
ncbi:MAG: glycosyltransferase [Succinivibrionaceae bacterium]